jgi:hypothetical protein
MTPEQEALIRKLDSQYAPGSEYVARNTIAGLRRLLLSEIDTLRAQKAELLEACKKFVHWYEVDSTEHNRDTAFYAAKDAIAVAKATGEKGASE